MNEVTGSHTMTPAILQHHKAHSYMEGVRDTLNELREVYGEGLEDTDLWREVMGEGGDL